MKGSELLGESEETHIKGEEVTLSPKDFEGYQPLETAKTVSVIDGMPPITFSYTEIAPETLSKLTVVKLKGLADDMGVEYTSSDTKQELIDKLTGGG